MRIGIIGTGYVGLVTSCVLSNYHNVTCYDIDKEKIENLSNGKCIIYENGLEDLLNKNLNKSLFFIDNIEKLVTENNVIFICVGTPQGENGSADLQYVYQVSRSIGQFINKRKVIVDKSTVPVGTAKRVKSIINEELLNRKIEIPFDVVSNPEFLKEGSAVNDLLNADRIIVGIDSVDASEAMSILYYPLLEENHNIKYLETTVESAELIKYASNAFLATKISFINEIAMLAEKVGANILDVAKGMGLDKRIGNKFLNAGCGYGGSCFPKDVKALIQTANENGINLSVVQAAQDVNQNIRANVVEKICSKIDVKDKTIAVWGLAFKPETDDTRESPAIYIIKELVKHGATINAYDPQGMENFKWNVVEYMNNIRYCKNEYECVADADCLIIITDWNIFKEADMGLVKLKMKNNILFDLRNIFAKNKEIRREFEYYGIGV